jgi:hypothetical protein
LEVQVLREIPRATRPTQPGVEPSIRSQEVKNASRAAPPLGQKHNPHRQRRHHRLQRAVQRRQLRVQVGHALGDGLLQVGREDLGGVGAEDLGVLGG